MMKRILSFFLGAALIVSLVVPVSAANASGWTELLEYSSVQANGENWFTLNGSSGTLTVPLNGEKRLRKVDMLVWNPTGQRPTGATVTAAGATTNLVVADLGSNMFRCYGYVPSSFYETLVVTFKKSSSVSATYELLSCKVTVLGTQDFDVNASMDIDGGSFPVPSTYNVDGIVGSDAQGAVQFPIVVYDWQKYDYLTITGSLDAVGLTSIRATIGKLGIPYEISYTNSLPTGTYGNTYTWNEMNYYSYDDSYQGESDTQYFLNTRFNGKTLFNIKIDLTGLDRTSTNYLYVYFTGVYSKAIGYTVQIVGSTGSVITADTSDVSWWHRFTSFMSDLFSADESSSALEDLGDSSSSISQSASDIHDFEQSQQAVLDSNLTTIQSAVTFTNFAAALVFVQRYANMTIEGISEYTIVFTLPLFLGLFFYLCSRIPGVTRWKSPPPNSKGGADP